MKKIVTAFGLIVTVAACASKQPAPPVTFEREASPKIVMDVKSINLADRSGIQPADSPYKDNNFSPTISEAIKQWAVNRLQAKGQTGQAIIIIKKASLSSQPLPSEGGIKSWFTREQSLKYIAAAEVSVEANGPGGFAVADAVASHTVTLPEKPTDEEKKNAYMTLLNGLMKDLGKNLDAGIHAHMANFITTAPVYGHTAVPMKVAPAAEPVLTPAVEDK